jgi:hypothetical protein
LLSTAILCAFFYHEAHEDHEDHEESIFAMLRAVSILGSPHCSTN